MGLNFNKPVAISDFTQKNQQTGSEIGIMNLKTYNICMKRAKTRQKGLQSNIVLMCLFVFVMLALRRSDRAKRLKQNNNKKLQQCSFFISGGPM